MSIRADRPVAHFAQRTQFRTISACGLWAASIHVHDPADVTCARCRRTVAYQVATNGRATNGGAR